MDAKAKVVNMLAVFDFELAGWEDGSEPYENLWAARCEYVRLSGIEEAHELLLTDHEAALAEERELRISLESSWQQAEAQVFALIEKHAALLTGLEALAGEMNNALGHDEHGSYISEQTIVEWAETLSTLASAGLEGKPDGND